MSDGQVVIDIVGDSARFERAVGSIGRDTERALSAAGAAASGLGGIITKAVTVPATAAGSAVVGTAVSFLSLRESAQTAFSTMLGSGEAASQMISDLYEFAKTTPFKFDGMLESAQQLVAMGMEASDVIPTLTAVGDAAAASGKGQEGFAAITEAIGKMQAQGQVALDDLWSLSDNGVSALQILANKAGTSVDEMKGSISEGAVDADWAIRALVEGIEEGTDGMAGQTARMGGLMGELKGTFQGACDSMTSAVRNFGLAVVGEYGSADASTSKFLTSVTSTVNLVTDIINMASAKWSEAGLSAAPAVEYLYEALRKVYTALAQMDPDSFASLVEAVAGIAVAGPVLLGFGKALQVASPAASAAAGALGSVAGALGRGASAAAEFSGKITGAAIPAVKDFARSMAHGLVPQSAFDMAKQLSTDLAHGLRDSKADIADAFSGAKEAIASKFSGVSEAVGSKLEPIRSKASELASVLGESAKSAADTFASKLGVGLGEGGEAAKSALGKVGSAAGAMAKGVATATGVLGAAATGLLGLGLAAAAGGADLQQMADGFVADMQNLTANLPAVAAQAAQILPDLVQTVTASLPAFLGAVASALGTIVGVLPTILPSLIEGVAMIIGQLGASLVELAPQLLDAGLRLFTALVTAFAEMVPQITPLIPTLVEQVASVLVANLPALLQAGLTLFLALATALLEAAPEIISTLIGVLPQLASTLIGFLPELGSAAGELFGAIVEALPKIGGALLGALGDLLGQLPGGIVAFAGSLADAGYNMIMGLVDGIGRAAGAVVDAAVGAVSGAVDSVLGFLGIASPSKLFRRIGVHVDEGLADGIASAARRVSEAATDMVEGLASAAEDAAPTVEVPVEVDWPGPGDFPWPKVGAGALLGQLDVSRMLEAAGRPAPGPGAAEDGGWERVERAVDRLAERVDALDRGLGRKIADNSPSEVSLAPGGMRAARRTLGVT